MKLFLITYQFSNGSEAEWHQKIAEFIRQLENTPELAGKISYRCMKAAEGNSYYHLATVKDPEVAKSLNTFDFFKAYTQQTELVAGGEVTVTPLELIAQTNPVF